MYNHRILSFLVFTLSFWTAAMISTFSVYLALSSFLSSAQEASQQEFYRRPHIKNESEAENGDLLSSPGRLSELQGMFPSRGRQPLRSPSAESAGTVKKEEDDGGEKLEVSPLTNEADDEEEYDDRVFVGRSDSGLGTSLEEGSQTGVARRKSNIRPGEDR